MNAPALVCVVAVPRTVEGKRTIRTFLQGFEPSGMKVDYRVEDERVAHMPGMLEQASCKVSILTALIAKVLKQFECLQVKINTATQFILIC